MDLVIQLIVTGFVGIAIILVVLMCYEYLEIAQDLQDVLVGLAITAAAGLCYGFILYLIWGYHA